MLISARYEINLHVKARDTICIVVVGREKGEKREDSADKAKCSDQH